MKKRILLFALTVAICVVGVLPAAGVALADDHAVGLGYTADGKEFIEWVDLNASKDMMVRVLEAHLKLEPQDRAKYGYAEILAYIALKNGNKFSQSADRKTLDGFMSGVKGGNDPLETVAENKYYKYYRESYHAIFDGIIGGYTDGEGGGYGVRGYCPIASGFWYNDYDDFGNSRSFGFKRKHLGHDMMGSVGTPIVAVEGGVVQELGWNRYGGWRVGIRSFDGKRYYYYAHLRKGRPYAADLSKGNRVRAGEVIGYLGNTGYSNTPDTNMTHSKQPHLHFGMQLIFDERQIDGSSEIWIDVYALTRFLSGSRRAKVAHDENYEYKSINLINVI